MKLPTPFFLVAFAGVALAGGQTDLQDAMEGIEGLMQRFERFQPQLRSLPRPDLESIATEGQQLHMRFLELQDRVGNIGSGAQSMVPAAEESRVIGFHRDLALFMASVESKLGITGPGPQSRVGFDGQPVPLNDHAQADARMSPFQSRTDATLSTDDRLQATMQKVADAMQRFEALHPHLRSLPPQVFNDIASRGQRLHEEFQTLQRRGAALSGGGRSASDGEAAQYVASFEAFQVEQAAFVRDAETQVQNTMAGGVRTPGIAAAGVGNVATPPGLPNMNQATPGGRVTPATDGRLSAVINKIVARMQEFEGLKPQFSRLPQQTFSSVAQRAQVLNDRFVGLQQHGTRIAGDGSSPMLESDALAYAAAMEAFHIDQAAFVEEAKQVIQSGGLGFAGGGMVGGGLGSATLNPASPSGMGNARAGLPPVAASPAVAPLGAAGFGSPSLGQLSEGLGQLPGASGLRPPGTINGFGGSVGLPGAGISGTQFGGNAQPRPQFGSPAAFSSGILHAAR